MPNAYRLRSYPFLMLKKLNKKYPYSVVNVITASISGENSVQGEKKFKKDLLPMKPNVLFIDLKKACLHQQKRELPIFVL